MGTGFGWYPTRIPELYTGARVKIRPHAPRHRTTLTRVADLSPGVRNGPTVTCDATPRATLGPQPAATQPAQDGDCQTNRRRRGFKVLPRRWVVERTFGWLGRHRRFSKDYEYLPASSEALIYIAMISIMVRRLAPT